jgi:8-oxo-dGTP diphosphatase
MSKINLIVRSVIIKDNHILLSTPSDSNDRFAQDLTFLPGGHVEENEAAIDALKRELLEEMGLNSTSESFLGALECTWDNKGQIYHELNLLFLTTIENLSLENPPACVESHLKFIWCPIENIDKVNILPAKLKTMIPALLDDSNIHRRFFSQMLT